MGLARIAAVPPVPPYLVTVPGEEDPMLALCCSMLRYSMLCTWYSIGGDVPPVPPYLLIVPGLEDRVQ